MSSEFFSSNHFQNGEHVVLLHTAKSRKVALVIGHTEQCNAWFTLSDYQTIASQCATPNAQSNLYRISYTAFSRKVVGKNVHSTIPKGNMGYGQYTVSNECSCRTYICCFPEAFENICPWPPVSFFQISSKNRVHSKPRTIPFGIVACTFSDNLSRNSCM